MTQTIEEFIAAARAARPELQIERYKVRSFGGSKAGDVSSLTPVPARRPTSGELGGMSSRSSAGRRCCCTA